MLQEKILLLRTEAGRNVGFGHAMRCLALAQAWKEIGGRAVFHMGHESSLDMERFLCGQFEVVLFDGDTGSPEDAVATANVYKKTGAVWAVVDGYQFDGGYQSALKMSGLRLLWVDDCGHATPYTADIVLNQNTSADEAMYSDRTPEVRILLGPRYALLRREFWRWRDWQRAHRLKVGHALVTFGGCDSSDMIQNVMSALEKLSEKNEMAFTVVSGFMPAKHTNADDVDFNGHPRARYLSGVLDMSPLMAESDLAIAGGGSTCWEMAFMGLPAIVYSLSLDQEGIVHTLDAMGVVRRTRHCEPFNEEAMLGTIREVCEDSGLRLRMSDAGRRLVDGRGGFRVVEVMREIAA